MSFANSSILSSTSELFALCLSVTIAAIILAVASFIFLTQVPFMFFEQSMIAFILITLSINSAAIAEVGVYLKHSAYLSFFSFHFLEFLVGSRLRIRSVQIFSLLNSSPSNISFFLSSKDLP